jgi:DNA-binding beta-propeller fold protein YncE
MNSYFKKIIYLFVIISLIIVPLLPGITHAFQVTTVKHLFDLEHGFLQPSDVAVGKDHLIYVLDGVNNRVVAFDEQGTFRFTFGGKGTGDGLFNAPIGLTTDSGGNVYVADTGNRRIQVFSPRGTFKSLVPVRSPEGENPSDPVDCAVDEKRQRLYVADNDNHRIVVYSLTDYKLLESWGSEGEGMQQLRNPFLIALAQDTSLLVVDVLNTRVQVWSPQGQAVNSIGDYGVDLGQLYRPKGVCIDQDNVIFVSDSYVGAIQRFNRYGHFKSVMGDETGKVKIWKTPVGITIDSKQRLYVVEMLLNRVGVYQILETRDEGVK